MVIDAKHQLYSHKTKECVTEIENYLKVLIFVIIHNCVLLLIHKGYMYKGMHELLYTVQSNITIYT